MATKMLRLESSLLYNSVYLMKVSNKRFVTPRYQNSSAFPPILNDTKIKEVNVAAQYTASPPLFNTTPYFT